MSNQVNEELSTACSVPNMVLIPIGETNNNIVLALEEFTIFLEQATIFNSKNNQMLLSRGCSAYS